MRYLAAILLIGLAGCSPYVDFVVPNGFRGAVFLIADPTNGVAITESNGLYTVKIPHGGKLRVQDLGFLERWHWEVGHFANGARIPTDYDPSTDKYVATNILALCGGSGCAANGEHYCVYFVGTRHDYYYYTSTGTNFAAP